MSNLPTYLLQVLRSIAIREGFLNHTIEEDPTNTSNHDGFIGSITSIRLIGERKKTANSLPESAELPLICKLSAEMRFFQIPKCYAACSVPERNEFLVVMENLRIAGFELWPKEKPLQVEQIRLVMEALGRFHGLSFAIRDQLPNLFEEFCEMKPMRTRMTDQPVMLGMLLSGYRVTLETMETDTDLAVVRRIIESWRDMMNDCNYGAGQFAVIGHNDLWINNMMFNGLEKICILDWQMTGMCSTAGDIAYFLFSSTDKELKDQYYEELINIYYDELSGIFRRCGSDPSVLFTRNNLNDQLRRFGKVGLTMAPFFAQMMAANENDILDVDLYAANIEKYGIDQVPHLISITKESKRTFAKRMSDIIADSIKYGWIDLISDEQTHL